jgi:hypothetical protein
LDSFRKYSDHEYQYIDIKDFESRNLDLIGFDIVIVHYSVRLPLGQLKKLSIVKLQGFERLKVLFIQDEYENPRLTRRVIVEVGFDIVYTVVPACSVDKIYPKKEFKGVKFISCLTGYVADGLAEKIGAAVKPSMRKLTVAYRGRSLPVWYGKLGQQKIEIGRRVREYCAIQKISCDIEWEESARIYGDDWYKFISSAKSMLGSESGSNVFDWSGSLEQKIKEYCIHNPRASREEVYRKMVQKHEIDGLMNQISPRIFEMAAAKTVMILLEGKYSEVLVPSVHYLSLRKDFGNLADVIKILSNAKEVDDMAERAYRDIISSGDYSYRKFIKSIDAEFDTAFIRRGIESFAYRHPHRLSEDYLTPTPMRAKPPLPKIFSKKWPILGRFVIALWQRLPLQVRPVVKSLLGRV